MSDKPTACPRLRQSVAKWLLKCPFLGHYYCAELGGRTTPDSAAKREGRLYEDLICGKTDGVTLIDAADFRKKAAQEARDAAIEAGTIPMLAHDYEVALNVAEIIGGKIADFLQAHNLPALSEYQQQTELLWESDGCPCGGRTDLLHIGAKDFTIIDLKKMARIEPSDIQRTIHQFGYDIQRAAYVEGVEATHPKLAGRGEFIFIGYQIEPPYFVVPFTLQGDWRGVGQEKWDMAKRIWMKCWEAQDWPDYAAQYGGIIEIGATAWQMNWHDGEDIL